MASTPPSAECSTTDETSLLQSPATSASSSPPPPPPGAPRVSKQMQRERERLSRKKRLDKTHSMRAQVTALEQTALAIRVAPDADSIWDEFLDDETKRLRGSLRRLIPVADEVKRLTSEKAQLQRLLAEHRLARQAIAQLINEKDNWEANTYEWKTLARLHFRRLTVEKSTALIKEALKTMKQFMVSQDKLSSGLSMMGWRDSRRLLPIESSLQFNLKKTYRGYDLNHHIDMMWRVFSEQELYTKVVMGGRARASVDLVQQLSPTAWVVRYDEKYDDMDVTIHELYLLFRVETENGAIQYLYSIEDSKLQNAMDTASDLWTTNYYWMKWDVLDTTRDWSSTDYRVSVGGCLRGDDPGFLHHWLFELFAMLVRSEGVVTDRPLLDFS